VKEGSVNERTLFIIKPDAQPVRQEIIADLLVDGFSLVHLTQTADALPADVWKTHYHVHDRKSFFPELIDFMCSGPVTVLALERAFAVRRARVLLGPTKLQDATPDTIRGKYGRWSIGIGPSTLAHASDSRETAEWELEYWSIVCRWQNA
jgi:nucleoside-diphosphate kinase